jgi:hypothetical protein
MIKVEVIEDSGKDLQDEQYKEQDEVKKGCFAGFIEKRKEN